MAEEKVFIVDMSSEQREKYTNMASRLNLVVKGEREQERKIKEDKRERKKEREEKGEGRGVKR